MEISDHEREAMIAGKRLFTSLDGELFLRYLEVKFGYNEPDWPDNSTFNDVKPHERRGMKMPIRFIHMCINAKLPTKNQNTNDHTNQKDSGEESRKKGRRRHTAKQIKD